VTFNACAAAIRRFAIIDAFITREVIMKKSVALLGLLSLCPATPVLAQSGEDLLKKNNCMPACHAIDKKVVGPAYQDVAQKYRGDATAPAKLQEKVKKGGSGVWGPVPMPPNAVSDADIKAMVAYILALKK
jgi:cytochrome c